MKANAAICFLLMSIALWVSHNCREKLRCWIAQSLASIVLIFSLLTLLEYAFGFDFGIDEFIFVDPSGQFGHSPPGRFSPVTAINFVLVTAGLLLDLKKRQNWARFSQALFMICFLISLQSFLGTLFGLVHLFGMGSFIPMAVHTAFSFTLLSVAFLSSRSNQGFMERFFSESPGAILARRLLLAVVFTPPAIRAISGYGYKLGYLGEGTSVFIEAMGTTIFMACIVVYNAGNLARLEKEREILQARKKHYSDQLLLVTEALPSLVGYIDADKKYKVVNAAYEKWFGKPKSYFLGKRVQDVMPEDTVKRALPNIEEALRGETVNFDNKLVKETGEVIYVNTTFVPDVGPEGVVRGFVVLAHDLTDVKRAHIELQAAKEQAEAASLAKTRFVANMSHEIRTPLGVITGFADLALRSMEKPEEVKNYLEIVRKNAGVLAELIGNVLDLSKVEAHMLEVEKINVSLRSLIDEVSESLQLKANKKGIEFSFDINENVPRTIESDPTRLRQILINLVGNALKFTEQGWVKLKVFAEGGNICFRISDSGIGISQEQIPRLFKPFSQADSSMNRKFGGTGLGLLLSSQLAVALSGSLELIASEIGEGSTFEVKIPYDTSHSEIFQSRVSTPTVDVPDLFGKAILLVEDSLENRVLISHYLIPTKAQVVIAENGLVALEKISSQPFSYVLMDIQMPVMDGFDAAGKMRKLGFKNPIIAITAHALKGEKEKALDAGFSDYLTKPISEIQLLKTIARFNT